MLSKGALKIVLYVYEQSKLWNELILLTPNKIIEKYGIPPYYSVSLKVLKNAGIYQPRSTKIYKALGELKKAGLIVMFKKPYPNILESAKGAGFKKQLTAKKIIKRARKDLVVEKNKLYGMFLGKKILLKEFSKPMSKTAIMKIMKRDYQNIKIQLKGSGMLWYPNQSFVYLTPDGMFLGTILRRLSEEGKYGKGLKEWLQDPAFLLYLAVIPESAFLSAGHP